MANPEPEQVVQLQARRDLSPPSPKRVPFGWNAFPVGSGESAAVLSFSEKGSDFDRLRFTYAVDERELKGMEIRLAVTGRVLEKRAIRFPYALQMEEFLQPYLLPVHGWGEPWEEALKRVASAASLQPYGWIEGCPLEGMREIANRSSRYRHGPRAVVGLRPTRGSVLWWRTGDMRRLLYGRLSDGGSRSFVGRTGIVRSRCPPTRRASTRTRQR